MKTLNKNVDTDSKFLNLLLYSYCWYIYKDKDFNTSIRLINVYFSLNGIFSQLCGQKRHTFVFNCE